jgi:hypothetical protein
MGEGDARVFAWFSENCTEFSRKYGLTPAAFADRALDGGQRRLFLWKLDAIYGAMMRMRAAEMEKERNRGKQ